MFIVPFNIVSNIMTRRHCENTIVALWRSILSKIRSLVVRVPAFLIFIMTCGDGPNVDEDDVIFFLFLFKQTCGISIIEACYDRIYPSAYIIYVRWAVKRLRKYLSSLDSIGGASIQAYGSQISTVALDPTYNI